ncbi:MAG: hypothetical protein OEY11_12225 [Gammaproteobacteria bacterium]|nr:hypothetical protein [Gammaproteobacteria bacterium]
MADFSKPIAGDPFAALLASIVENNQSTLKMLDGVASLVSLPVNAKRWNATNKNFENWNGTGWDALATLYEIKVRNSDQLNGQTEAFYRNANNLNAGSLPAARFGDSSHGARAGGSLHAVATTLLAGFMSSSDKSKLNGIENNATADQSAAEILALLLGVDGAGSGLDADLLDGWQRTSVIARANHTGTQLMSTISNAGELATKNTTTVTHSGTLTAGIFLYVPLNSYAFLPMIYTSVASSNSSIHSDVNGGADSPKVQLYNGSTTGSYTIKYRRII